MNDYNEIKTEIETCDESEWYVIIAYDYITIKSTVTHSRTIQPPDTVIMLRVTCIYLVYAAVHVVVYAAVHTAVYGAVYGAVHAAVCAAVYAAVYVIYAAVYVIYAAVYVAVYAAVYVVIHDAALQLIFNETNAVLIRKLLNRCIRPTEFSEYRNHCTAMNLWRGEKEIKRE